MECRSEFHGGLSNEIERERLSKMGRLFVGKKLYCRWLGNPLPIQNHMRERILNIKG